MTADAGEVTQRRTGKPPACAAPYGSAPRPIKLHNVTLGAVIVLIALFFMCAVMFVGSVFIIGMAVARLLLR